MTPIPSKALVIFGATGDLAQRMLFPSLYFLEAEGFLPKDLIVIGCSRGAMDTSAFQAEVEDTVRQRPGEHYSDAHWTRLKARLRHAAVDAGDAASFANLKAALGGIGEVLYYLSTSPSFYGDICRNLKEAGL